MLQPRLDEDLRTGLTADRTLEDAERRVLSALDESPIGTALVGLDGRFLRVNRAYSQIVGYSREELLTLSFHAITHPADVDVDREWNAKLVSGAIPCSRRDKRYVRKDGSIVFVRLTSSVVRDDQGAPLCQLSQVEDITERVRADEALRRSESDFRRLFDQASDGIFIMDLAGRYTDVNDAGCEMLGYSREELVGKTVMDLVPTEDAPRLAQVRQLMLCRGLTRVREEGRLRRKDGVFISIEVSSKFLLDGREVAFVRDVSDRKRAEREREESLRWTRAVFEQSPVGLALCHGHCGQGLECNSRLLQMIGTQAPIENLDQLRSAFRMPDGARIAVEDCPGLRALCGDSTHGAELVLCGPNGGSTPVIATAAPIVGPDGAVLGAVIAFQDIATTKELERLRAEWNSVVAHDLRQPLGSILLCAQVLARATNDPNVLKYVERVRAAATRVNRMVGDLMDLSRLEASRLELSRQSVDVTTLVHAAAERARLETADRSFDVRPAGEVPEVCADPDRIAQVLENLLTNAVKYGKAGTPIVMGVAREGGEVAVSVTNEGRAVTPEEITTIFQRFQRTSSAKLQRVQGVGLGLYITRSLVEAHGGRITVESSPAGATTFRFTLPVVNQVEVMNRVEAQNERFG
jgi:PAS domain S-box-containing protein